MLIFIKNEEQQDEIDSLKKRLRNLKKRLIALEAALVPGG